jgi:outer membrane protein TolC
MKFFYIFLIFFTLSIWGQQYSYNDIVKKTLEHNNKLKELQEQIVQSDILIKKSYTFLQPIWTLGGRFTINNTETAMDFPDFSSGVMPPPTSKIVINEKYAYEINSNVNYTLMNLRALPLVKVAKEMKQVSILSKEMAIIEIKFVIAQLYLNALTIKEGIKVKEIVKKNLQEHLGFIQEKLKLKDALEIEKTSSEIEIASVDIDIKKLEGNLRQIKSQLAILMGIDKYDFTLSDLSFEFEVGGLNEIFKVAQKSRLENKLNLKSLKIEKLMLDNIYMKFFPTLTLQAGWKYGNSAGFTGDNSSWNINLLLNFSIYDGGVIYKELAEERSKIRALDYKMKQFNDDLKGEIKTLLIDIDNINLTIEEINKQKELVEKNLKQTEEAYQLGVSKNIDVLDASHNLQLLYNNLVIQKLNRNIVYLKLKKALGKL